MDYPDRETYRKLYARYLTRRPAAVLLDLAGDLSGKRVVDLCGGAGELSVGAAERGAADVTWVDQCAQMCDTAAVLAAGVSVHHMDVGLWLFIPKRKESRADVIFCRQAVNYWLDGDGALSVAENLRPGGLFIFNTFNRKPAAKPTVKEYELEGRKYVEVSWLGPDNVVRHVQNCEGLEPHATRFDWISPKKFREWLGPFFEVEERRHGGTSLYRCQKK